MNREIRRHEKFVKAEIEKIEKAHPKDRPDHIAWLRGYHITTVRDFQHERLAHLIVTLFFAILFLFSLGALFFVAESSEHTELLLPLLAIGFILMITELFYVKHYYKLENGVQKLYKLTKKLYSFKG